MAMPWSTFTDLNPSFVASPRDHDLDTAWAWSLHVRVPEEYGFDLSAVETFHKAILAACEQAHSWLACPNTPDTPAACGGDSFAAWCEPFPYQAAREDHRALHLYFGAPDADSARLMAVGFLTLTGLTTRDVALSTAGDWAEQVPIPEAP